MFYQANKKHKLGLNTRANCSTLTVAANTLSNRKCTLQIRTRAAQQLNGTQYTSSDLISKQSTTRK
jgi:hypothetical protein